MEQKGYIEQPNLDAVFSALADPTRRLTEFKQFWGKSFDQLDDLLINLKQTKEEEK